MSQLALKVDTVSLSRELRLWFKAALRECLSYGEHGMYTEVVNGREVCMDCGGEV